MADGEGPGIVKKILYPGTGKELEFTSGSKVISDAEGERFSLLWIPVRYGNNLILFNSGNISLQNIHSEERRRTERGRLQP